MAKLLKIYDAAKLLKTSDVAEIQRSFMWPKYEDLLCGRDTKISDVAELGRSLMWPS